jgi:hypothetical protein
MQDHERQKSRNISKFYSALKASFVKTGALGVGKIGIKVKEVP